MAFAPRRSVYDDLPNSMVHICRLHGVRLTAFRFQVATIFDDSDAPMDALEVWERMRAKGIEGNLSSVYRLMREMKLRERPGQLGHLGLRPDVADAHCCAGGQTWIPA